LPAEDARRADAGQRVVRGGRVFRVHACVLVRRGVPDALHRGAGAAPSVPDATRAAASPARRRGGVIRGARRSRRARPARAVRLPPNPDSTSGATAVVARRDAPEVESGRSEEHTSELQSRGHLVCRLLLEKKKNSGLYNSPLTHSFLLFF